MPLACAALLAAALLGSPVLPAAAPAAAGEGTRPAAPVSLDTLVEGEGVSPVIVPLGTLRGEAPGTRITAVGLTYQGVRRAYLVIAPARVRAPLPLVLKLAGSGSEPTYEADRDELYRLAMQGRAIVVYPAEQAGSWNLGVDGCCGDAVNPGLDDAGFVLDVLAQARRTLPVLPGPVRLMGYSGGGKLGYALVCAHPELFRSFTAVAATPLAGCPGPQPPLAFQLLVGADDPELPYKTDPQPAAAVLDRTAVTWRARDRCALPATVAIGQAATVVTSACAAGTRVQTVLYGALDHGWPTPRLVGDGASALALFRAFTGL